MGSPKIKNPRITATTGLTKAQVNTILGGSNFNAFTKEVNAKGDEYEKINNRENFIILSEAQKLDKDLQIGDFLNYDLEFEGMGRNASSILFSNLEYKLQKFISDNQHIPMGNIDVHYVDEVSNE